jgi:hypothetical protein
MRRAAVLVVCLGLALAVWGAAPARGAAEGAAVAPAASPSSDFVPWVPSESWPGGRQYDPRLERTVAFWGAGMPLREVFAGVKEQTGVEIGFWPAGDVNERVCVTLYLNPEKPPTLRELMAQLSWVTDCGFGVTYEEGDSEYWLLSTSSRYGAESRLRAESRALLDRVQERRHGREEQTSTKVAAKLAALSDALALPREEAIRRYRGADDLLLLALLEPGRRRAVEFTLALPEDDLVRLLEEGELRFDWDDLSSEQRSALGQHFRLGASGAIEQGYEYVSADPSSGWRPSGEVPFTVVLTGARYGLLVIRGEFWSDEDQEEPALMLAGQHVRLVPRGQHPEEAAALLRALGEEPDSTGLDAIYDEADTASQAERRQWLEQQQREWMQSELSKRSIASYEVRNALTAFRFPGARDAMYPLWAVQEAVAAGTGLHIVSDCFSQPSRGVEVFLELLEADEAADEARELTGLLALKLWALSAMEGDGLPRAGIDDATGGWEWEDAGEFLRFRHVARDLWRAAFLPEGRLRELDEWLKPYVTEAVESERDEITIAVSLDIRQASRIARHLDDFQLYHGGKVIYRDPADVEEAYRQRLREEVLAAISRWAGLYRLFGTFSEHQWEGLCGPGLRWSEDLTPAQQAMEVSSYLAPFREQLPDVTVRLTEGGATEGRGEGGTSVVRDTYVVEFVESGERERELPPPGNQATPARRAVPEVHLPRTVVVRLKRPARLVAAPDTAGRE